MVYINEFRTRFFSLQCFAASSYQGQHQWFYPSPKHQRVPLDYGPRNAKSFAMSSRSMKSLREKLSKDKMGTSLGQVLERESSLHSRLTCTQTLTFVLWNYHPRRTTRLVVIWMKDACLYHRVTGLPDGTRWADHRKSAWGIATGGLTVNAMQAPVAIWIQRECYWIATAVTSTCFVVDRDWVVPGNTCLRAIFLTISVC